MICHSERSEESALVICHSERSEESALVICHSDRSEESALLEWQILRCAQDDTQVSQVATDGLRAGAQATPAEESRSSATSTINAATSSGTSSDRRDAPVNASLVHSSVDVANRARGDETCSRRSPDDQRSSCD